MGLLPQPFGASPSGPTVNYNFAEFSSGRGIVTLYPVVGSGGLILSSDTAYNWNGNATMTGFSSNGNIRVYTDAIDIDFDTTLQRPINVKGEAKINFTNVIRKIGANSNQITMTCSAALIQVRGSTETVLGTGVNTVTGTPAATQTVSQEVCHIIPIDSVKHFRIGDKIRLNFQMHNSSDDWDAWILCDSKNREISIGDFTSTFSVATLQIPVVINI